MCYFYYKPVDDVIGSLNTLALEEKATFESSLYQSVPKIN